VYKSSYLKRKKYGRLFLEAYVEPDWYDDVGEIVPLLQIVYRVYYKDESKNKGKIEMEIYRADYYNIYIKGKIENKRCSFYDGIEDEESEYVYADNTREFFRYLRHFEYDLRKRFEDIYSLFKDDMSESCRKLFERNLYE